MNRFVRIALSAWMILAALGVFASAESDFESNVPQDPFSWVLYTVEEAAEFEDNDSGGEVAIEELDFIATPLYMSGDPWQAVIGLGFHWTRLDFGEIDIDDLDLYAITLPLDLIYAREPWTFWGNITPGLFSDLEEIGNDDARVLVHALGMYDLKPNLQLALGVAYDQVFGDDKVYPMAGAIWKIGKEWELNFVLPMPRITYAPGEKLLVFADAKPAGNVWNINDDVEGDYDLKIEGYRFGLGFEYELARHVWLHAAGGMSTERKYELRAGEARFEADADDTYFARGGIVIR